jgi:fibronectin type 3 domain-containing protein
MSIQNLPEDLPARLDIGSKTLIPRSQGSLGACASWTVATELTRYERIRNRWPVGKNSSFFSPLYLYNQVNGGKNQGSSFYHNLTLLADQGCSLYITFPYVLDPYIQPGQSARREAARYRINEWQILPEISADIFRLWLAKGHGIMATFLIYENFDGYKGGVYRQQGRRGTLRDGVRQEYHGCLIIGYDDRERTFKAVNSWGTGWGEGGFFRFSYDDLPRLVAEAYVLIPKDNLPSNPTPPSKVEAGRGSNRKKIIISWAPNGADEYEVWRLGEEESYNSLGRTSAAFFEDSKVQDNKHYFYYVTAHKNELMSELSLAAEGWTSQTAQAPGVPGRFRAERQGDMVAARWDRVENADSYAVYRWDEKSQVFILAGETRETNWKEPLPDYAGSSAVSYFATAKNASGESLPSEISEVLFEYYEQEEESGKADDQEHGDNQEETDDDPPAYKGSFYKFPARTFYELEKRFKEDFLKLRSDQNRNFVKLQQDQRQKWQDLRDKFRRGK